MAIDKNRSLAETAADSVAACLNRVTNEALPDLKWHSYGGGPGAAGVRLVGADAKRYDETTQLGEREYYALAKALYVCGIDTVSAHVYSGSRELVNASALQQFADQKRISLVPSLRFTPTTVTMSAERPFRPRLDGFTEETGPLAATALLDREAKIKGWFEYYLAHPTHRPTYPDPDATPPAVPSPAVPSPAAPTSSAPAGISGGPAQPAPAANQAAQPGGPRGLPRRRLHPHPSQGPQVADLQQPPQGQQAQQQPPQPDPDPATLAKQDEWKSLQHWQDKFAGHLPQIQAAGTGYHVVKLPSGNQLHDHGGKLETDDQNDNHAIVLMVAMAKKRGWSEIHFTGGDEEFRQKIALEAKRQNMKVAGMTPEQEAQLAPQVAVWGRFVQDLPAQPASAAPTAAPAGGPSAAAHGPVQAQEADQKFTSAQARNIQTQYIRPVVHEVRAARYAGKTEFDLTGDTRPDSLKRVLFAEAELQGLPVKGYEPAELKSAKPEDKQDVRGEIVSGWDGFKKSVKDAFVETLPQEEIAAQVVRYVTEMKAQNKPIEFHQDRSHLRDNMIWLECRRQQAKMKPYTPTFISRLYDDGMSGLPPYEHQGFINAVADLKLQEWSDYLKEKNLLDHSATARPVRKDPPPVRTDIVINGDGEPTLSRTPIASPAPAVADDGLSIPPVPREPTLARPSSASSDPSVSMPPPPKGWTLRANSADRLNDSSNKPKRGKGFGPGK